jgi:hypothetical protein
MANERLLQGRGLHQILARNEIKAARYLDRYLGTVQPAELRDRDPVDAVAVGVTPLSHAQVVEHC